MGSLSKFFATHIDLLAEAFDLDENNNLIELDRKLVAEADRLVHDLFVNEMRGILNELVIPRASDDDENDPHAYRKPKASVGMLTNPVVFSPKDKTGAGHGTLGSVQTPAAPTPTPYGGDTGTPYTGVGRGGPGYGQAPQGERLPSGTQQTPNGPALPSTSLGSGSDQSVPLQTLQALAGKPPDQINQYLRANGIAYDSAAGNYCMALANAYQHSIGRPGTGSLVATSVLRYGTQVDPKEAGAGDLGVYTYGHRYGETGGHAVTITGPPRQNPNTGALEVPVLSSHGVGAPAGQGPAQEWRPAAGLEVHRWTPNGTNIAQVKTDVSQPQNAPKTGPIDYTPGSLTKTLGVNPDQYNAYREGVARIEGGRYDRMGGSSGRFAGRYQMGGNEIKDTADLLGETPPSTQQFLSDPQMQERYFEAYTLKHHETLLNNPKYANAAPDEKLKILGYAHNQGAGGASKWLNTGQAGRDAFGTSGTAYYAGVGKNLQQVAQSSPTQQANAGTSPSQQANAGTNTQGQPPANQGQPAATPAQTASNAQWTPTPGGKIVPVGDSLAYGLGGVVGNTKYSVSGSHPDQSLALMNRAAQSGDLKGAHVVISGGISNSGGHTEQVDQYYPQMVQAAKAGGASNITIMGVGPYSHFDNYGYHGALAKVANDSGVNYTGPLAKIAPFRGSGVQQQVHPADYAPIASHIQKNFNSPTNVAQNQPATPTQPPVQTASAAPPAAGSSSGQATPQKVAANTPPVSGKSSGTSGSSGGGSSGGGSSTSTVGSGSGEVATSGTTKDGLGQLASNDQGGKSTATESRSRVAIRLLRS